MQGAMHKQEIKSFGAQDPSTARHVKKLLSNALFSFNSILIKEVDMKFKP